MTKYLLDTPKLDIPSAVRKALQTLKLTVGLFACAFVVGVSQASAAATCTLRISYQNIGGEQVSQLYTVEEGKEATIDSFTLPINIPITFEMTGTGFNGDGGDQCRDSYAQIDPALGGLSGSIADLTNTGGDEFKFDDETECRNDETGNLYAQFTHTIGIDQYVQERAGNTRALIIKFRDKKGASIPIFGDRQSADSDLCKFTYPVDEGENNYADERLSGVQCFYPTAEGCPAGAVRMCPGTRDGNSCVAGANLQTNDGQDGSVCTPCAACADYTDGASQECPMGCDANPGGALYSPACADRVSDPDLKPICNGDDIFDANEFDNDRNNNASCLAQGRANTMGVLQTVSSGAWILCEQAGKFRTECENCKDGLWTTFGCIPTNYKLGIARISSIVLGMVGGLGLLRILLAAFYLSISRGDPKQTDEAKQMIEATVIGLLFIIFSISILQFIGVDILAIPGFGEGGGAGSAPTRNGITPI